MKKVSRLLAVVLLSIAFPLAWGVGTAHASATDCPYARWDPNNSFWYGNIGLWQSTGYNGGFVCVPDGTPNNQPDLSKVYLSNGLPVATHVESVISNSVYDAVGLCTGKNYTGNCVYISPGQEENLPAGYANHIYSMFYFWGGN